MRQNRWKRKLRSAKRRNTRDDAPAFERHGRGRAPSCASRRLTGSVSDDDDELVSRGRVGLVNALCKRRESVGGNTERVGTRRPGAADLGESPYTARWSATVCPCVRGMRWLLTHGSWLVGVWICVWVCVCGGREERSNTCVRRPQAGQPRTDAKGGRPKPDDAHFRTAERLPSVARKTCV